MGQYWRVYSPSASKAAGTNIGKLGESLFDGWPRSLVPRFAVPVLQSDSDQGPDAALHEEQAKRQGSLLSADSQSAESKAYDLNDRSAEHQRSQEHQAKAGPPIFSSLPVELHDLIFEELDIEDILSLSLTNLHLWEIGQRHIHSFFMSFIGPWAGESVICVGDYLMKGDYPPGRLTEAEKEEMYEIAGKYRNNHGRDELMSLHKFLVNGCRGSYPYVEFPEYLLGRVVSSKRYNYYGLPKHLRDQIVNALTPEISQFFPENQPWILRNLSTREYVCSEAIALKPEYIHGPNIDYFGFGEVILSRICWSSDPSVSTPYKGGIHRGVWAGHRFDITTLARHEQGQGKELWVDVSEEVAEEIEAIWEAEYGSDWREVIVESANNIGFM
ncbi:hypothetical protein GP486_007218 [Trichoglossum hirsutum]|uniref:F-box domain-containing protein n=1 Tax=Trichoglossum hirsutum TaxID=265104 RepID=A0A9P8L2Y3_9PEZI|nr:hypothetical protein GP486_007218 [Trichoglossum hirsutum]